MDVAVELDPQEFCDDDADATAAWVSAVGSWRNELEALVALRVDLHLYLVDSTPIIKAGLQRSHVLAYQKVGSSQLRWLDSFQKRTQRSRVLVGH